MAYSIEDADYSDLEKIVEILEGGFKRRRCEELYMTFNKVYTRKRVHSSYIDAYCDVLVLKEDGKILGVLIAKISPSSYDDKNITYYCTTIELSNEISKYKQGKVFIKLEEKLRKKAKENKTNRILFGGSFPHDIGRMLEKRNYKFQENIFVYKV